MGMIAEFFERVTRFQPTTWWTHTMVAWGIWLVFDNSPQWLGITVLALSVAGFLYREYLNFKKHKDAGHDLRVWIGDGVGDMIGPLTVFAAAVSDPWIAHAIGFGIMGLGSVVWVGLGYAHYGGKDA